MGSLCFYLGREVSHSSGISDHFRFNSKKDTNLLELSYIEYEEELIHAARSISKVTFQTLLMYMSEFSDITKSWMIGFLVNKICPQILLQEIKEHSFTVKISHEYACVAATV